MSAPQESSSPFELMTGRNALRSLALAGGVALHAINVYVVTTIMPTIVRSIGGLTYYAWSTTLFVVASILGSALSYRLIDRLGPRRAYLSALGLFCAGSLICASAPAMWWLLAGRTVQGLAGGVLLALSYALIRMVYEPRLWARALAFVSAMWGVATLSGPALGGLFATLGWWRPAFLSLLPVAAALAAIVHRLVPASAPVSSSATGVPWGKLGMLACSVLAISVGSLSTRLSWNAAGLATGLALVAWMARLDLRGTSPLLPTGAYSPRTILGACYLTMAMLVVGLTSEIFVPYFLQAIHGQTPLAAGYLTAVMAGGWTLASLMLSGRTGDAVVRLVHGGPLVTAAGLAALAMLMPHPAGAWAFAALCLALAGVGFGIGMCWSHLVTRVFRSAPPGQENLASGAVTTLQLYGIALGAALAGMVANAAGLADPGGLEGARTASAWLFGLFALTPAVAAWSARRAMRP
ncbi:MFS transporter [Pigmentiphaga sp. NML080357]|uniref:MFS transporter n=1 Tax=Pigmentiphaga sp. NML080357 TaxID=2008675 RepID=UPI000B413E06|nr:MFS transporter [Pigmentiphaga sp. NML080357]OVZ55849.1 MFS transporter [Pigmentiphaga sp. NML080357]